MLNVVRKIVPNVPSYQIDGTQYIENEITFPTAPDTTTIYLSEDLYTYPGKYVLFDYSESTSLTPVSGDLSQVNIDISDLSLSTSYKLFNSISEKKIILQLQGRLDGGTQYINGTLTINDPVTIYLDSKVFSYGTYTLFDWSGGGSFSGSITNITIIPPTGYFVDKNVSPNGCAISGSTITVKLV